MRIPGGRVAATSLMRVFTRCDRSWAFSPFSMITMPPTTSPWPLRVTAPFRSIGATSTAATSRTSTGTPAVRLQHDALQLGHAGDEPHATHGVPLVAVLDEAAAERLVVVGHGLQHVAERQGVLLQPQRIHDHLELLGEPAPRVHLAHARHRAQPRPDVPVVRGLGRHGIDTVAGDDVLVDLAEGRGHRPEHGIEALGNAAAHVRQPFGDQLPREVDGHRIVEHHRDDGEAELRDRADLLRIGHAHEGGLDGVGDPLLHFGRGQAGRLGDHHDLVVGEVGEGLDGQLAERHDAREGERGQAHQDEDTLPEGGVHEAFDEAHGYGSSLAGWSSSDFNRKAPAVATTSPSFSPLTISTSPSISAPGRDGAPREPVRRGADEDHRSRPPWPGRLGRGRPARGAAWTRRA